MRKCLLALLAIALMIAGVLTALVRPQHCPVNRAAFERIEEGMTQAEVHAILGGPPGDYRTGPLEAEGDGYYGPVAIALLEAANLSDSSGAFIEFSAGEAWTGDDAYGCVYYSPVPGGGSLVNMVRFEGRTPYSPGLVKIARWRLGKLGEAWLP